MTRHFLVRLACAFAFYLMLPPMAVAADWRFPVGLSYVHGFNHVADIYKNNIEYEGYSYSESDSGAPISAAFHPYLYFGDGLAVDVGIGPIMVILSDVADYTDVPVNADFRYIFFADSPVASYGRVGVRHHFADGPYVKSSSPGLFASLGLMFLNDRAVAIGAELSMDNSTVTLEEYSQDQTTFETVTTDRKVRSSGFMLSVFAVL